MKSAFLVEPGRFEVRELPIPQPGPGEVLVKVAYCGVCTLEQRLYKGDMTIFYPIVPGHEVSGTVEKLGPGVHTSIAEGDDVAVDMVYRCHGCRFCRSGQSNLCENRFNKDLRPLGGFSEYVCVRAEQVFPLAEPISLAKAAFAEPVACCLRSLKKLNLTIAEDLLVIGAGPMGLLHLQAANAMGARVIVSDVDASRLRTAKELGARMVVDASGDDAGRLIREASGGLGVDACVLTSPADAALSSAFDAIKKGGRINIYTAYMQAAPPLPADLDTIHRNEILITGSEGRTELDFQQAARLLSFGMIDPSVLISMIAGFGEIDAAVNAACGCGTQRVLLEPGR